MDWHGPLSRRLAVSFRHQRIPEIHRESFPGVVGWHEPTDYEKTAKDETLARLARLDNVVSLDLSDSRITDEGVVSIERMPALRRVFVGGTVLSEQSLQRLADYRPQLDIVRSKSDREWTKHFPALDLDPESSAPIQKAMRRERAFAEIARTGGFVVAVTPENVSIHSTYPGFCGLEPVDTYRLVYDEHLKRGPFPSGRGVDNLTLKYASDIDNLCHVDIGYSRVTDEGLRYLKDNPTLESLYFTNASISNAGLKNLGSLPRLQWLDFRGSKVTAAGYTTLKWRCPLLRDW
jgi:hypothetical protein